MTIRLSHQAIASYEEAPGPVQKAFDKQLRLLATNLRHPSLHAKKYDAESDVWQARINRDWRFYFRIVGVSYLIIDLMPHPK
jgi:plasmid maintenance system killer protein